MKEKTCKLCQRKFGGVTVSLNEIRLCGICFNFMLSKYGTIKKVISIMKTYKNGGRK